MRMLASILFLVVFLVAMAGCEKDREKEQKKPKQEPPKTEVKKEEPKAGGDPFKPGVWVDLFDGKSLDGWKVSEFGAEGKPKVENGLLIVTMGQTLSGVTSTRKDLPKMGYEIELDAQKLEASLVLGGWGGSICGISSLDYQDAANNETTKVVEFKAKQWYHVRMRILPERLKAWLDEEPIVDVDTKERKVDIRIDISESVPFGLATYQTVAAYKNVRVRRLTAEELNPKD
jgi:hypothetical protein